MKLSPRTLALTGLVTTVVGLAVGFVSFLIVSAGFSTYDPDAAPSETVLNFALVIGMGAAGVVLLGTIVMIAALIWAIARVMRNR